LETGVPSENSWKFKINIKRILNAKIFEFLIFPAKFNISEEFGIIKQKITAGNQLGFVLQVLHIKS
jgi:hypothetical protein